MNEIKREFERYNEEDWNRMAGLVVSIMCGAATYGIGYLCWRFL